MTRYLAVVLAALVLGSCGSPTVAPPADPEADVVDLFTSLMAEDMVGSEEVQVYRFRFALFDTPAFLASFLLELGLPYADLDGAVEAISTDGDHPPDRLERLGLEILDERTVSQVRKYAFSEPFFAADRKTAWLQTSWEVGPVLSVVFIRVDVVDGEWQVTDAAFFAQN